MDRPPKTSLTLSHVPHGGQSRLVGAEKSNCSITRARAAAQSPRESARKPCAAASATVMVMACRGSALLLCCSGAAAARAAASCENPSRLRKGSRDIGSISERWPYKKISREKRTAVRCVSAGSQPLLLPPPPPGFSGTSAT